MREVSALEKHIKSSDESGQRKSGKSMQKACGKMDALAKKLGKWDPQATIRKFRDTNLKGGSG